MSNDRYPHAMRIAREAGAAPASQRARILETLCNGDAELRREVAAILDASSERTFAGAIHDAMTTPPGSHGAGDSPPPQGHVGGAERATDHLAVAGPTGIKIGAYAVLRVLGEGGMGMVYLAEQERPRRTVALKVIRPGLLTPKLLRRFEHESQILGRLQHPGIAQIYEAGQYDRGSGAGPQPFFAMELVEGVPLTDYCSRRQLPIPDRLALFVKVCDAVQHAHVKGVIHRDLKPANVLVVEGHAPQPKVLDFGVARAVESDLAFATMQTDAGQIVGTVPYMSPEQISGGTDDVDARSDVYTLGVILYELLSGRLPHSVSGKTIVEAARTIGFEEPRPLGSIDRSLAGDLQTIVAKALEKDRARRYQSASDLAADITRFLRDEPILARPPSTAYQLAKFAKRHRALVAGAGATVLMLLMGVAGTTWKAIEANRERAVAEDRRVLAERAQAQAREEAENALAMNDFLTNMLASIDPELAHGREVTMREVVDQASREVATALQAKPRIEASLRSTLARTYQSLSAVGEAEKHAREAVRLRMAAQGIDDPETVQANRQLAIILNDAGKHDEAEQLLSAVLAATKARGEKSPGEMGVIMGDVASCYLMTGRNEAGEKMMRDGLALAEAARGGEDREVLTMKHNLGVTLKDQGRFQEAVDLLQQVLKTRVRVMGPDHPDTLSTLNSLAAALTRAGQPVQAIALQRQALESRTRVLGEDHVGTLTSKLNLAVALVEQKDLAAAEPLIRAAYQGFKTRLGEEHARTQIALNGLAYLLEDKGQLDEAEALYRRCVDIRRRASGGSDPESWAAMNNLASLLQRQGKLDEAAASYEEVLALCTQKVGISHYAAAIFANNYGECLTLLHRFPQAEESLTASHTVLEKTFGEKHPRVVKSRARLAALYDAWGKPSDAANWR